jgi:hypothetical protein
MCLSVELVNQSEDSVMAHIHGAKETATVVKAASKAPEMAGMTGNSMGEMGSMMGGMGMGGMGPMMGGMGGMGMMGTGQMMMPNMPNMPAMAECAEMLAKGAAATGVALSARSTMERGLMYRLSRNPWVLFGLGVAAGYFVHKYRKEIIRGATRIGEKGKGLVLQQRENLEDLVAEAKESGEDTGKPEAPKPD